MSWIIRIQPIVKRDLREARAWYAEQGPGLSEAFQDEFENTLTRIGRLPLSFMEIFPRVRRVNMRRFPYGVFYTATEKEVVVMAVTHHSRDPRVWQRRV